MDMVVSDGSGNKGDRGDASRGDGSGMKSDVRT